MYILVPCQSPHLFLPFCLCRCVSAIVITLVIDHSSSQAPTSLPSLETAASAYIRVNMPVRGRTPLNLTGTTNPSAEAYSYGFLSTPTLNEKDHDVIHKDSHSSP